MVEMFNHLDDAQYTSFRKTLIKEKGSKLQQEFLTAATSDKEFVRFVRENVRTVEGKNIPILVEKLSEHEYKDLPVDTENKLYITWKTITPKLACSVSFWGEATLKQITNGRIHSYYLAANGGALAGGIERIEKSLSSQDKSQIDSSVRTIIRRMSGLPEARGNRSQYVDCPFGRAWWRKHLLVELVEATNIQEEKFSKVLRLSQTFWENLVNLMVSRNSILGARNVRYSLIWALADLIEKQPDHEVLQKTSTLRNICRLLGVRCAWQELGILELSEIKKLIEKNILY